MHSLRGVLLAAVLLAAVLIGSPLVSTITATAQVMRVGGEFQINTYTPNPQNQGAVAADADGNFVVAWASYGQLGFVDPDVFAQRYDSGGNRVGSEFQVNTYSPLIQRDPHIAVDPDGDFAIVYDSEHDGSNEGIFAQRYSSGGARVGTEFQVNTYTPSSQRQPAVVVAPDGTFVVVWDSVRDGGASGVFGQRLDSAGAKVGTEFQVNTYTPGNQRFADIAIAADGGVVVVWQSTAQDGALEGAFGQRFSNAGARVGTEFQISTYTPNSQSFPHVAADADGDFTVVWGDYGSLDGSDGAVMARRFTSAGTPSAAEFIVNTFTQSHQIQPGIAANADGDFVVTWMSLAPQDGSGYGQFARRFSSSGNPLTTEFQVNSFTLGRQYSQLSQPIADTPQGFVIAWWSNGQDGSNHGVFGQRFALTPGGCPPVPDGSCHGAAKHFVLVKDKTNDAADQVKWKWRKGTPMLVQNDFGDPVGGSTGYRVCVYDKTGGTPSLKFGAQVDAGGNCPTSPCWKALGDKGYKYTNPSTNAQGIKKIILKGGNAGTPKVIVIGKGTNLTMPGALDTNDYFDQDTEVVVQLNRTDSSACWQSTFGTATTINNTAEQFKAKIN